MARYDRGVTQRYASRKRKRRVVPGRPSPAVTEPIRPTTTVDEPDEEESTGPVVGAPPRPTVRISRAPAAAQPAAPRRTFASYAEEYRYVVGDLRRVALVGGGLLLVLIVLSFFLG